MKYKNLITAIILFLLLDFGYENFVYITHLILYIYCAYSCIIRAPKLNYLDLSVIGFFIYAFFTTLISSNFTDVKFEDISCIGYCFVYLYFKKILNDANNKDLQDIFSVILTATVSLNLIGTLLKGSFLINNPFPLANTTLLANFLAIIILPFIKTYAYRNLSVWYSIVFAFVNQARISIFLFSATWIYMKSNKLKVLLPSLVVLLTFLFFFLKEKSTEGRFFILNNTLSNYKLPLSPQGLGNYKSYYIELQAKILETMDRNDPKFMSVDYPNYLFNDFLQILIELGLIGLFAYILIFFISVRYVNRYVPKREQAPLYLFLIIYIVLSLTSYPFYIEIFRVILLLVLAFISSSSSQSNIYLPCIFNTVKVIFILYFFACLFFLTNLSNRFQLTAFNYLPFKNKFLYQEAYKAYQRSEFTKAVQFLNETSVNFINMDKYILSGNCFDSLKREDLAIRNLSLATYYYPNRFKPKYYLFHYKVHNNIDATIIAQDILNTPTKVPNSEIIKLKEEALLYLNSLENNF